MHIGLHGVRQTVQVGLIQTDRSWVYRRCRCMGLIQTDRGLIAGLIQTDHKAGIRTVDCCPTAVGVKMTDCCIYALGRMINFSVTTTFL